MSTCNIASPVPLSCQWQVRVPVISDVSGGPVSFGGTLSGQAGGSFTMEISEPILRHDATGLSVLFHEVKVKP